MDKTPDSNRDDAIAALSSLLRVDPLYRPAEFLMGYVHLSRGDAKNAVSVFDRSVERFEADMRHTIDQLAQEWLTPLRWPALAKRISFVRHFGRVYLDATISLHGGDLARGAQTWIVLKSELAKTPDTKSSRSFHEAHLDALAENLSKNLGGSSLPAIAAGRMKSDETSQKDAHTRLDAVLGAGKIQKLDMDLYLLEAECINQNVHSVFAEESLSGTAAPAPGVVSNPSEFIADLTRRSTAAQIYFEANLKEIESLIAERKWEAARQLILRLRQETRSRNPLEFPAILANPETETWKAWIASLFVPALGKVRRRRRELREPLYIESVYYLAYAHLIGFEPDGLRKAQERARKLREERLVPNQDLSLLTVCLEIEALVRLLDQEADTHASIEIYSLLRKWTKDIQEASLAKARKSEVRAAAYVALGMIKRDERRKQAEREQKDPFSLDREKRERFLYQEEAHYRHALELKESATTHCYIAECLIELDRKDDAALHVRRALLIAPDHLLAKRLAEQLPAVTELMA